MSITHSSKTPRSKYHHQAYHFVLDALTRAQQLQGRNRTKTKGGEEHVSGPQLLEGFRQLAYEQFGALALTVFRHWGVTTTNDVGMIVWELIELGSMKKTDQDQLTDFFDLYSFEEVFGASYPMNVSDAFPED